MMCYTGVDVIRQLLICCPPPASGLATHQYCHIAWLKRISSMDGFYRRVIRVFSHCFTAGKFSPKEGFFSPKCYEKLVSTHCVAMCMCQLISFHK